MNCRITGMVCVLVFLITLTGCEAKGPAEVVKAHIRKCAREDIAGASMLCTGQALENTESFHASLRYAKENAGKMGMEHDFYLDDWPDLRRNMNIDVISETENAAMVKVAYEDRMGIYTLTKIDGTWFISRFKDHIFGFKASVSQGCGY